MTAVVAVAGFVNTPGTSAQTLPVVESTLYEFGTNVSITGAAPCSRLTVGTDGALYGTTSADGPFGFSTTGGTVFKINHDGSGFQVLHAFGSVANDGFLTIDDPQLDNTLLLGADHALYGTAVIGGTNGYGAIYRITEDGSSYQILHSFDNIQNDAYPAAGLIQATNGALYGISGNIISGSPPGAIFRLNPDGSGYTVLTNIGVSYAALLQGQDGGLYGTSYNGASSGQTNGIVFRINLDGSGFTNLHTFDLTDGRQPVGQLIQAGNGFLLGTTEMGGTSNLGTIFMINTNGGSFQVLHNFSDGEIPGDGQQPRAGLALGPGGIFYGTTAAGGATNHGSIFKVNQDGSGYEQLFSFPANDFNLVNVGLVQWQQQGNIPALYGTAETGGLFTHGGIFTVLVNPPLSITPVTAQTVSNQVTVFWPAWAFNYVLQSTTNLSSSNWVTVTNGVSVIGVQVPNTNPGTFYRLVSPN